jgi:hypothetical protein
MLPVMSVATQVDNQKRGQCQTGRNRNVPGNVCPHWENWDQSQHVVYPDKEKQCEKVRQKRSYLCPIAGFTMSSITKITRGSNRPCKPFGGDIGSGFVPSADAQENGHHNE